MESSQLSAARRRLNLTPVVLVCLVAVLAVPRAVASTTTVFDSGARNGTSGLRISDLGWIASAADFELNNATSVTGAQIWTTEYPGQFSWAGSVNYDIYADSTGQPVGPPLYSGSVTAVRTADPLQDCCGYDEYSYRFDFASPVPLHSHTRYWLAVNLPGGGTFGTTQAFWASTSATFGSNPRLVFDEQTASSSAYFGFDLAFRVFADNTDSTPPTASPTQAPAANGAGWNNSDVTVAWNWADETDGSGINSANCTPSSVSSAEGNPVTLTATCNDLAGNLGTSSYDVKVDKTAPTVSVSGVTNGGQYVFGAAPTPGCDTTDGLSGVATVATVSVANPPSGVGLYTATCSGATDVAGNPQASDVSVSYTVVYGFGNFTPPLPKSTLLKSGAAIPVKFQLATGTGIPLSAGIASALAAADKLHVTLAGPPSMSMTVPCVWDDHALLFYCYMKTPQGLETGPANPYTITAYEDVGTGFVAAPPVGTAVNPETVYFK